ncbi:flagellar hook protein FlgE [Rhodovulum sulfidophilum]|uniref:Flagellar hook protein FlgE n=1 Tax=Rhodovulum sulfidophilum TaxID=35806 RepID=A0A0D6AY67_RHOSU|nr:flagellar hook protein FlgE [Rhodovulum sulfidophilum]
MESSIVGFDGGYFIPMRYIPVKNKLFLSGIASQSDVRLNISDPAARGFRRGRSLEVSVADSAKEFEDLLAQMDGLTLSAFIDLTAPEMPEESAPNLASPAGAPSEDSEMPLIERLPRQSDHQKRDR